MAEKSPTKILVSSNGVPISGTRFQELYDFLNQFHLKNEDVECIITNFHVEFNKPVE